MKHFKHLITIGLLFPALVFSYESNSAEDDSGLISLEKELLLLDQEFDTFNEELFSIEKQSPAPEPKLDPVAALEPETIDFISESSSIPVSMDFLIKEEAAVLEEKRSDDAIFSAISEIKEELQHIENEIDPLTAMSLIDAASPSLAQNEALEETPASLDRKTSIIKEDFVPTSVRVDLSQAFQGAPVIYSLLLTLSIGAFSIWLYAILAVCRMTRFSTKIGQQLRNKLNANHFEEALFLCEGSQGLLSKMIASGIYSRKHGLNVVIEAMKTEGKRHSMKFWQNIGMLNDIAIIAPMVGLLGTVLGMFYAFYNVNRSIESISTLFDGLGVSVGTTVAGLIVAITALVLHSIAKYTLVKRLAIVENEAQAIANLIDDRTSLGNRG